MLEKNYFYALSWLISETGKLKDEGLKFFAITEALQQTEGMSHDDALDQSFAAATGTPETAGLAPHECLIMMQELEKEFRITGADLVEVAPFVHFPGESAAMEQTLDSAQMIAGYLLEALKRSRRD